jgi:hypothetical protein
MVFLKEEPEKTEDRLSFRSSVPERVRPKAWLHLLGCWFNISHGPSRELPCLDWDIVKQRHIGVASVTSYVPEQAFDGVGRPLQNLCKSPKIKQECP